MEFCSTRHLNHIHTWRCGHASDEPEEDYIKKAVEYYHAESISFTDHAPFPNDPFTNRMHYEQLPEYVATLKELKEKYKGIIDVRIGLEIEWLPSFRSYYEELKGSGEFDLLMLGQHFWEVIPGSYSFALPERSEEDRHLMEAIYEGMESGFFDVVAHPDRVFRNRREWQPDMAQMVQKLFELSIKYNIPLEYNGASLMKKSCYRPEFWAMWPRKVPFVLGLDAHSTEEMWDITTRMSMRYY